jgi:hypothetical protein
MWMHPKWSPAFAEDQHLVADAFGNVAAGSA